MKQNNEKNSLAYYNGAIVEVLENRGTNTVIKIKGGSRASVLTRNLQPTEEKKTRLPEWLAVGSRVYHNGKIKTLTRVGNTRYEAESVGCWYDGQIAGLLANGRPVCDSDTMTEEPHQALADLQRLLAASVEDLNIDTADLLQLQFLAASVGFDELALYVHGLQCTNTEPNPDELREIAEDMLWTLQGEIEEYEEEADDMRNDLESERAAGYDKYLDYRADPSDKAAIEEAKAEFNEVIAERIKDINEHYTLYVEPAAARLRSFLAAFSAVVPQPEDPAQCTMIFEAEADADSLPLPFLACCPEVEKVEETTAADADTQAPAEVEKVEEKAPAFATVGDMAAPNITPIMPADSCPEVGEVGDRVKYKYSDYKGTIIQSWYHDIYLNEWRCTVVLDDGKEIHPTINNLTIITAAETPAAAVTDADVLAQAAQIKAAYETMQTEADQDRADLFAAAIVAYCDSLAESAAAQLPEPPAVVTVSAPFPPTPRRRRRRFALLPLRRWFRAAAVVLPLLVVLGLLTAASGSHAAADDAAAVVVAQVVELEAVTVTAEAPQALIEERPQALIEDEPPAPSPVKNEAEAAECSSQKTDADDCPAGEKTASPMATASDSHGLTVCEGTPWAYTMMNWA